MPARGVTRFVLLAVLVVGVIYYFSSHSPLPDDWKSSLKASAESIYPISKDSPAFPDQDFASDAIVANPAHPVAGAVKSELPPDDLSLQGKPSDAEEILKIADTPPVMSETDSAATSSRKDTDAKVGQAPDKAPELAPKTDVPQKVETFLPDHYIYNDVANVHRTVYSISTKNKKYFPIIFGDSHAYNPNIIPHRSKNDTYIIVAQESEHSVQDSVWFAELVCNAQFIDDKLKCIKPPSILPITATYGTGCHDNLAFFGYNVGPHDARLFYGPTKPFVLYGSNSAFTCFGQFVQDFRMLLDWGFEWDLPREYRAGTEVQRPDKYGPIEKNWFLFWDAGGEIYAHYDIAPQRVFAKLNADGTVGKDLAPEAKTDAVCLKKYMPAVAESLESIHQATNALSVTLCNRSDPACVPSNENTFVFHLFHHKSYYSFHSNYEPYIMLFQQTAPFAIHSIGQKPVWINGRGMPGQGKRPEYISEDVEWHQTEMFYITSIAWAAHGQKYHGYMDDILFINFGIEDSATGGIDVLAGELLKDLALCSSV